MWMKSPSTVKHCILTVWRIRQHTSSLCTLWLELCSTLILLLTPPSIIFMPVWMCICVRGRQMQKELTWPFTSLCCVIKSSEEAEFLLKEKKKNFFDGKMAALTSIVAQWRKSFPSIPSVIVSVFRFLCENDGWQVKFVSGEWRWTVTEWFVLGMEG